MQFNSSIRKSQTPINKKGWSNHFRNGKALSNWYNFKHKFLVFLISTKKEYHQVVNKVITHALDKKLKVITVDFSNNINSKIKISSRKFVSH